MGSEYGVSDLFRDKSHIEGDSKLLEIGSSFARDVGGFIISIGVWGLIIGQFLMTMCDLLYITFPPIRGLLVGRNAFGGSSIVGATGATNGGPVEGKTNGVKDSATCGGIDWSKRRFISMELVRLFKSGKQISSSQMIKLYFRRRLVFMIIFVVCVMLLVLSNVFMKTGMNVGEAVLRFVGL